MRTVVVAKYVEPVYNALCSLAKRGSLPTQSELARTVGCTTYTAFHALQTLEKSGKVVRCNGKYIPAGVEISDVNARNANFRLRWEYCDDSLTWCLVAEEYCARTGEWCPGANKPRYAHDIENAVNKKLEELGAAADGAVIEYFIEDPNDNGDKPRYFYAAIIWLQNY